MAIYRRCDRAHAAGRPGSPHSAPDPPAAHPKGISAIGTRRCGLLSESDRLSHIPRQTGEATPELNGSCESFLRHLRVIAMRLTPKLDPSADVAAQPVLDAFDHAQRAGLDPAECYRAGVDAWRRIHRDQTSQYAAVQA